MTVLKQKKEIGSYECDDFAYLIDSILNAPGFIRAYKNGPDQDWIMFVGDDDMQEGVRSLSPTEKNIIKMFFLEGKSLVDISYTLNISIDMVYGYIKSMKVRLTQYV